MVRELIVTNEDSTFVEIRRLVEVVGTVLLVRLNLSCGCVVNIEMLGVLTDFIGKEALVDIWRFVVVIAAVLLVHEVVRSDSLKLCRGCVVNLEVLGALGGLIGKEALVDI